MSDFLFARSQMAMSLMFHIVFAAMGIGLPLLMVVAEGAYLRTGKEVYPDLCQRWSRGAAILFAVVLFPSLFFLFHIFGAKESR